VRPNKGRDERLVSRKSAESLSFGYDNRDQRIAEFILHIFLPTVGRDYGWERRMQWASGRARGKTGLKREKSSAGPDRPFNLSAKSRCRFAADTDLLITTPTFD
jgi:hypothetical protein